MGLFLRKTFLGNALAKHSLTLFVGVVIASVLNYFFHLLVGRMVSVESYGEIESLNSMINIIAVPAMAIMMAATRYAASFKADDNKAKNWALLRLLNKKLLIFVGPIFLLFLVFIPWISRFLNFDNSWPIFILGLYLAVSLFSSINIGTLSGWKKFADIRSLNVWGAVVKFLGGIILVKLGFSVLGAIAGYFLGALFAYLLSFKLLRFISAGKSEQKKFEFDFKAVKDYILVLFWGNLALNVLGNADMVLAKHNLDPAVAGQYGALTIVSKIIFFATSIIATVMFSLSAENHHKKEASAKIFFNALLLTTFVSATAIVFYFLFPEFVLGLLFGHKYIASAHYLGWFGVLAGLFSIVNLMFQYLLSIHKNNMAYSLLLISLVSSFLILFTGHAIYDILRVAIISQVAGIAIGAYFLFTLKDRKPHETNLNYNPVV